MGRIQSASLLQTHLESPCQLYDEQMLDEQAEYYISRICITAHIDLCSVKWKLHLTLRPSAVEQWAASVQHPGISLPSSLLHQVDIHLRLLLFIFIQNTLPLLNQTPKFTPNALEHNRTPCLWSLAKLKSLLRYLSLWMCKQGAVVSGGGEPIKCDLATFLCSNRSILQVCFLWGFFNQQVLTGFVFQLYFKIVAPVRSLQAIHNRLLHLSRIGLDKWNIALLQP